MRTTPTSLLLTSMFALITFACQAEIPDGTWRLEKAIDYEVLGTLPPMPQSNLIHLHNGTLTVSADCTVQFHQEKYHTSRPFQALLKSGESESAIDQFIFKHFKFRLADIKLHYQIDLSNPCNKLADDILMTNDKLLLIHAGFFFYTFTKAITNTNTTSTNQSNTDIDLQGIIPSSLPFNPSEYMTRCAADLSINNGKLRSTKKCSPAYNPYAASKHRGDWISKLVGTYPYQKNGAHYASPKYNNPVANGFHPIFTILPPFKNIIVVRVDDLEWSQDRDAMSGIYLSIKNKKVIDILNEGCSFDTSYTCSSSDSDKRFQLQPDGHFKRIQ